MKNIIFKFLTAAVILSVIQSGCTNNNPQEPPLPVMPTPTISIEFLYTWGNSSTFDVPFGITYGNTAGKVYVPGNNNHNLIANNVSGTAAETWGSYGTTDGYFCNPTKAAVNQSTGMVYVTDMYNHRVQVFNSSGVFQYKWGTNGTLPGELKYPCGISVNQNTGRVYVTEPGNYRVQVFDAAGNSITNWGTVGSSSGGQFQNPTDVSVDNATGKVYVADSNNRKIQIFDAEGTYLDTINIYAGYFASTMSLSVDSANGRIFEADRENNRLVVIDSLGNTILEYGQAGTGNGQFSYPEGIYFDTVTDTLFLTDTGNNRVQVFRVHN